MLQSIDARDVTRLDALLSKHSETRTLSALLDDAAMTQRILSRAFLSPQLLLLLECLAKYIRLDILVDPSLPGTKYIHRGNTLIHWLFEWFHFLSGIDEDVSGMNPI
jgi:hypothetical protein